MIGEPVDGRDPYEVLGVPTTASQQEIAHAYRSLVRQHHPDSGDADTAGGTSLGEVVAAYAVLRDPARRAQHDQQRSAQSGGAVDVGQFSISEPPLRAGPVRRHDSAPPARFREVGEPPPLVDLADLFRWLWRP
ncbi:J domain-containing protein [Streptoalloteichus hindustanus]|uniref:DnaJ domain-containing protein n=1 Tax=Streptoalloteichus hindustanus TaxID=2017 RepID=A0A1M4XQT5_STRHI|nr:J domain-containing protein [Streptoalloteichus hindustanus]SHE95859.1 DnaJ domain-containing protein [Streptoalloteichus hindustanus]